MKNLRQTKQLQGGRKKADQREKTPWLEQQPVGDSMAEKTLLERACSRSGWAALGQPGSKTSKRNMSGKTDNLNLRLLRSRSPASQFLHRPRLLFDSAAYGLPQHFTQGNEIQPVSRCNGCAFANFDQAISPGGATQHAGTLIAVVDRQALLETPT